MLRREGSGIERKVPKGGAQGMNGTEQGRDLIM